MRTCCVCHAPALMGFHPLCLLNSAAPGFMRGPQASRAKPCGHCPFRKDRPFWLEIGWKILNLMRLRRGAVQHCHHYPQQHCAGAAQCLHGGNHQVFSIEEFAAQTAVKSYSEARAAYNYEVTK